MTYRHDDDADAGAAVYVPIDDTRSAAAGGGAVPPRPATPSIITLSILSLILAMPLSLIGPFFPGEAVRRGVSLAAAGWILSAFPLAVLVAAPLFGRLVPRLGPKVMIVGGGACLGLCTVAFAAIDAVSGPAFIASAASIRILQGAASAAASTGSSALIAALFPDDLGKIIGSLEVCGCAGYMLGPFLGGLLFDLGGYRLPFYAVGSVILATMVLLALLIPRRQATALAPSSVTVSAILSAPGVTLVIAASVTSMAVFSFLDLSLQPTLAAQNLPSSAIGLVFVMISAVYAITSPIIGYVVNSSNVHFCITAGMALSATALVVLAMASIPLRIGALALLSAGCAVIVVPVAPQMVLLTKHLGAGATDVMSGVLVASYSLGESVGPLIGGALMDWDGMRGAAPVFAIAVGAMAVAFSRRRSATACGVREPLLRTTITVK